MRVESWRRPLTLPATWYRQARLISRAGTIGAMLASAPDERPDLWWDAITRFPEFRPLQRRQELLALVTRVRDLGASLVCEIGTASGGTLAAIARAARPDARIVTIDRSLPWARRMACARLGRARQRIACIEADSHSSSTRDLVSGVLGKDGWDMLFIDGDHSLSGVERDFALYAPCVRPGGIIVLHDIVADLRQRRGIATSADSGDVPQFWALLKSRHARTEEIVEDPRQDGCGLGVITV